MLVMDFQILTIMAIGPNRGGVWRIRPRKQAFNEGLLTIG